MWSNRQLTPNAAKRGRDHSAYLRVAALGVNTLAICVGWPMLFGRTGSGFAVLGPALATAVLATGLVRLARRQQPSAHEETLAAGLLLVAFPAATGASMLAQPQRLHFEAFGLLGVLIAGASMLAYAAAALTLLGTHGMQHPHRVVPVRPQPWDTAPDPPPPLQRAVLALGILGATALALVAPLWGGIEGYERDWGDAAMEGATLTATAAAALGATVVGVFIGGAVRTARSSEPAPSKLRTASLLAAGLLGLAVYLITQPD